MEILTIYTIVILLYSISSVNSNRRNKREPLRDKSLNSQNLETENIISLLGQKQNPKFNNDVTDHEKGRKCPGRRIRKEIRRMSPQEWKSFTDAVNMLKQTGEYDKMAAIHRGEERISHTHYGPNFLGWHRIYLLCLESLLRRVNPCVTIPYWDSSLDYAMENPVKSVLWTDELFGNGFDNVTSGPFKNWVTGQGQNLTRFLSVEGSLISMDNINTVISRPSHSIITVFADNPASIEYAHNMLHGWVGGQMGCFPSAAEDPVFWTVHSFIDCWWQKFRKNLMEKYGMHAIDDYPNVNGTHSAHQPMTPFTHLEPFLGFMNRDGYRDDLMIYECEDFPTCSKTYPDCKSPFLYCDLDREICVSLEAKEDEQVLDKSKLKSETAEYFLSHPKSYSAVEDSCTVKYGTTELAHIKALGFPMEYLPKVVK